MRVFSATLSLFGRRLVPWVALLTVGSLLSVAPARAQTDSALPGGAPTRPLSEVLNPDGSLKSGINGSFDATGYKLSTGPGGAPLLRTTSAADVNWDGHFGLPGTNGPVYALAMVGTDLYVGGAFTLAGGVPATNIAKWDGTNWTALAGGGTNAPVRALAVGGTDLYIGGDFTTAGGAPANHVAKWDGTTWGALGLGINGPVHALAVLGTGPDVFAGGGFVNAGGGMPLSNVGHWNGSAWLLMGTPAPGTHGTNDTVRALTFFQNDLYVGGDFTAAASVPGTIHLARWTLGINTWSALAGGPVGATVRALAANPGALYVGGDFVTGGGPASDYASSWAGGIWSPMQSGGVSVNARVRSLTMNSFGTALVAGGDFTVAGTGAAEHVAVWSSGWSPLRAPSAMNLPVYAVALPTSGSHVFAGGTFTLADGRAAQNIAEWNGTTWMPLGPLPLNNIVNGIALGGTLGVFVGGDFTLAGGAPANRMARWNSVAATWSPLINSVTPFGNGVNGSVYVVAIDGPDVYVGGKFTTAGGLAANNIAKWNTTTSTWSALIGGGQNGVSRFGTAPSASVIALTVASDGLYVGGLFDRVGTAGPAHKNIVRWAGGVWSAVGSGLGNPAAGEYLAGLATMGNRVYACGEFVKTGAGLTVNNIAQWTISGTTWAKMGGATPGTNATTRAVAVAGTDLYVGGWFTTVDGSVSANRIARWSSTSSTWSAVGAPGVGANVVYTLAVDGTDLYVGGSFSSPHFNIAKWDIACPSWTPLGSGTNNVVYDVAATATEVYAGGAFTAVQSGLKNMYYFGIYHTPAGGSGPPDLLVTTTGAHIAPGVYHDIMIIPTADAILDGDITVTGTCVVQGQLYDGCHIIRGCGSFVLNAGGYLRVCDAAGLTTTPTPAGTVQVLSARGFSNDAFYEYNGSVAQSTGNGLPIQVRELISNNPAGVTLTNLQLAVRQALRLQAGVLTIPGGKMLGLMSSVAGTAYATHVGGLTSGNVTVQRYIENTHCLGLGYRHLSSPVQTTPFSDLNNSTYVAKVNTAYNAPIPYLAGSIPPALFPTVFGFDETRGGPLDPDFSHGWYSPNLASDPMTSGRGWSTYMKGASKPDFVGALTTGNVPVTGLTLTGASLGSTQKSGWHLIGNPYPEPIDWDLVTPGVAPGQYPPGMSASISVYRDKGMLGYEYLTRVGGIGSLPNGEIGIGQGFFVRVLAGGPLTFTFVNALRVPNNFVRVYRPVADSRPVVTLTLAALGAPAGSAVETTVYVEAGATPGLDEAYDGTRPGRNGGVPTLASLIGTSEADVNGLPEATLTAPTVVELLAELPAAGTYALEVRVLANFGATAVALLDRQTGTHYNLASRPVITFAATRANEEVRGRFALVFNGTSVPTGLAAGSQAGEVLRLHPNPATAAGASVRLTGSVPNAPVDVFDALRRRVTSALAAADGTATLGVRGLAPGVYTVRGATGRTARLVVE